MRHSPRNCSARHSACGSEASAWLSSAWASARPSWPLRRSIAAAAAAPRPRPRSSAASAWSKRRRASCEVDAAHPERQQRDAQAQRVGGRPRRAASRGPRAGWPPRGRAAASRARARPARAPSGRAARRSPRLAGLVEALARVHADGLQQPVRRAVLVGDHEATSRPAGRARRRRRGRAADGLDRLELEAAREDGEPAEQRLLVRLEQVVAPLQRGGEGVLARGRRAARAAQHAEAVVEPLRDRRRAERAQARRRELERERQAVEAEADARDVRRVALVEREARRRGARALDEQLARPRSAAARRGASSCSGSGISSDGTRNTTSPGTRSGSRLVATIVSCGAERSSVSASSAARGQQVLAVVDHQQQRARGERLDDGVEQLLAGQRPHVERRRDGVRDQPRRRRSRRARRAPPVARGSAARASSSASRVLPVPPVPVSVSRRVPRSRTSSAASWRARPTNELASAGRAGRRTGSASSSGHQLRQLGATAGRPVVVAVLRQQLAARRARARRGGRRPSRRAAPRRRPRSSRSTSTSAASSSISSADAIASGAERPPRDVDRLVQVVGGGRRLAVAPQLVHRLLAVQAMAGRQREQLHQLARLAQPPRRVGNRTPSTAAEKPPRSVRNTTGRSI